MFYVYVLRSIKKPEKTYVGYTQDIANRLELHNSERSEYTAKFAPWELLGYIALNNKDKAIELEKYLKTSSGKAFLSSKMMV